MKWLHRHVAARLYIGGLKISCARRLPCRYAEEHYAVLADGVRTRAHQMLCILRLGRTLQSPMYICLLAQGG